MQNFLHKVADGMIERKSILLVCLLRVDAWALRAERQARGIAGEISPERIGFFENVLELLRGLDMYDEADLVEAKFRQAIKRLEGLDISVMRISAQDVPHLEDLGDLDFLLDT